MSISLIPDSAPFNDEQKAWLNGFLAGIMGLQTNGNPAAVLVSQAAAAGMPAAVKEPEFDEDDVPWHDPGLNMDERLQMADGRPLKHRLMAAMAQLDCGSCGYICKTYSEAIASGEETNLKLCSPGGKETAKMLKQLVTEAAENGASHGSSNGAAVNGATVNGAVANGAVKSDTGYSRKNPYTAKLIRSVCLNGEGSAKDVRHVEIDLGNSGLTYKVGDALGVYPTNCDQLVQEILEELECDPAHQVTCQQETVRIDRALKTLCCLKDVADELIELVYEKLNVDDQIRLKNAQEQEDWDQRDVLDLLREFPVIPLDPQAFINTLSPLLPRLYSIASSQAVVGKQVHLTVGKAFTTVGDRLRKGVASTMFAERMDAGAEVRIFVQPAHGFGVPADDRAPLIMIGPGTGIAPFRAFLQERQQRQAAGKNWLFFGDQKADCDFLYRDELEQMLAVGLLNRLDTAFSRDQAEKIYVQNRMLENGAEFYQWLQAGATVCVCGDAKRMAVDVDQALQEIIACQGNCSTEQAKHYVAEMVKQGRYLRDVY